MRLTPDLLAVVVLGYLRKHARGRAAARTQGRIGWDLRVLGVEVTIREVRDLLAEMAMGGLNLGRFDTIRHLKKGPARAPTLQNRTPKKRGRGR